MVLDRVHDDNLDEDTTRNGGDVEVLNGHEHVLEVTTWLVLCTRCAALLNMVCTLVVVMTTSILT
jgi:hypothetical protein